MCISLAHGIDHPKVKVIFEVDLLAPSSKMDGAVQVRPRPQVKLMPGRRFSMCDGKRCMGEKCTHAHSEQELQIWNDELEACRGE